MFEVLMLLGFGYAGFCHLFPAAKEVRHFFGGKTPPRRAAAGRRRPALGPSG
jgi:hypothetical protein